MSAGFRAKADKAEQPIKIYWLLDELKKRKIAQTAFAARLGIRPHVLTGRSGVFPADKVDECMQLLENWQAVDQPLNAGGRKTGDHPWDGPMLGTGKRL